MPSSPRGDVSLRAAIRSYREAFPNTDKTAKAVMYRLLKCRDGTAAAAFSEIAATDATMARRLLLCCIEAETLRLTFTRRIERETEAKSILPVLLDHVDALRRGLMVIADPARDRLTAGLPLGDEEYKPALIGLAAIEALVLERLRIAYETIPRVGGTQKYKGKDAAYLAAVGWIAGGMKRYTGQPQVKHTINLAVVSTGMQSLTEDQVRKAYRTREAKDWRQAFPTTGPFRLKKL